MRKFVILCSVLSLMRIVTALEQPNPFPVPEGMELRVQFWVDVFTQYSVHQVIFFDADKPERMYSVVDFEKSPDEEVSPNKRQEVLGRERKRIVSILQQLSLREYREEELEGEFLRIYRLFGEKPNPDDFLRAAACVRAQGGMKETFKQGIERSGRYLDRMKAVFQEGGLPEELVYLVHVESSFNCHARSKSDAVGMWQFTRPTGRLFLDINHTVDERKDPYLSTEAAALLLKNNFAVLGTWPLAITAYNHGLAGMKRAVQKTGSGDLSLVVRRYQSRSFGFASKNFYSEFLAALHVSQNPFAYFGEITYDSPERFQTVKIPFALKLEEAATVFRVEESLIQQFNPALDRAILKGTRAIPKGYALRLPEEASVLGVAERIRDRFEGKQIASQNNPVIGMQSIGAAAEPIQDSLFTLAFPGKDMTQVQHVQSLAETPETLIERERFLWQTVPFPMELDCVHVSENNKIEVLPEETLGHYADWLEIPTWQLRKLNDLRHQEKIRVGEKLKLAFVHVDSRVFEERRLAFHRQIQSTFFKKYSIENSEVHTVQPGETLWAVVKRYDDIPLWLLMQYNAGKDLHKLRPGDKLVVPVIRQVS